MYIRSAIGDVLEYKRNAPISDFRLFRDQKYTDFDILILIKQVENRLKIV